MNQLTTEDLFSQLGEQAAEIRLLRKQLAALQRRVAEQAKALADAEKAREAAEAAPPEGA